MPKKDRVVGGFSGYPISDNESFPESRTNGRNTFPKAKWVKNPSPRKP